MSIGHNAGINGEALLRVVKQVEGLEADKEAITDDIKDVYTVAKSQGLAVSTVKAAVKARKTPKAERDFEQQQLDQYLEVIEAQEAKEKLERLQE